MSFIGLVGRAQAGKDTIARFLVEDFGYRQYALADQVRKAVLALDPFVVEERVVVSSALDTSMLLHPAGGQVPRVDLGKEQKMFQVGRVSEIVSQIGWDKAKQIPEVRRLLQRMGTEVGRSLFDEDAWIGLLWPDIAAEGGFDGAVVSDVRFVNEAAWVRDRGGVVWKVTRPKAGVVADLAGHASEQGVDGIEADVVTVNDGSLDDLRSKVRELVGDG